VGSAQRTCRIVDIVGGAVAQRIERVVNMIAQGIRDIRQPVRTVVTVQNGAAVGSVTSFKSPVG